MDWFKYEFKTDILTRRSGSSFPIRRIVHWTRNVESNNNSKRTNNTKRNHFYKYLLAIVLGLPTPALANTDVTAARKISGSAGMISAIWNTNMTYFPAITKALPAATLSRTT